jgi:hypothetical protein
LSTQIPLIFYVGHLLFQNQTHQEAEIALNIYFKGYKAFLALDIFEFGKGGVPKHKSNKNNIIFIFSKEKSPK